MLPCVHDINFECDLLPDALTRTSALSFLDPTARTFAAQRELDMEAFVRAGGSLDDSHQDHWRELQRPAYRDAFILAGIDHPRFRATIKRYFPVGADELEKAARRWRTAAPA